MPTNFEHRLVLIVPVANVAAVVSWFQTNIGSNSIPNDFGPGLSPTGNAPITHRWCSGCFNDIECKAIMLRLCNLSGVTPPTGPEWAGWNRQQKIIWLESVQTAMRTNFGIWVTLSLNDGVWNNPEAALATMGLQRVT